MASDPPWPEHLAGLVPTDGMLKGQYEITGFLGEGGFGAVFAGVQHPLKRPVAIKVMFPGHNVRVRERFLREAQAVAGLRHPNSVIVYDFGLIDQRRPFIVMELLDGHDLGDELHNRGPMERERALGLFMGALESLSEAHELGIVHRDIKPENLFLAALPRGREALRVLDFGIARMMDDDEEGQPPSLSGPRLTPTGQKVGTPHYLSPEYFESGTVTPALDVYAMALVLAEMLSGEPVVQAPNLYGYVIKHIRGQLAFKPELQADPIWPVIQKATARDPGQRYPNAQAFLEALEDAIGSAAVLQAPPSGRLVVTDAFALDVGTARRLAEAHEPTRAIPDNFVYIKPGEFDMGSPPREPGRNADEVKRRTRITRGFLMGRTPVTQRQWSELIPTNPSCFEGEKRPVEQVTWYEALAFCNAMSERDGLEPCYRLVEVQGEVGRGMLSKRASFQGLECEGWRLPTEAEWEYACRAGSSAARYGELVDIACYDNNSRRKTGVVGRQQANAWGLHDMLGNVWEWCWDRYGPYHQEDVEDPLGAEAGQSRIYRGGCYTSAARLCRAGNRGHSLPARRLRSVGFRVVRTFND